MSVLVVPVMDEEPWPTLGPLVADWIEANLVHGPGALRGKKARLDDEKRALLYRMYEVYPRRHAQAGRRRFPRVAISLRKGSAKTEFAEWIAAGELHPRAPVRCCGFDRWGEPIGTGVTDPYIPMLAYTQEQSEDLAYGGLRVILELSAVRGDFDIGLERIMRVAGDGKACPLAAAPDARDGALTTFQHFDETHRFTLPRLVEAYRTMQANLPKRVDAWSLETTTAPAPGEGSVAEKTMEHARAILDGSVRDPKLFFFHRQAPDDADLSTDEGVRQAVLDASGPMAEWSNIDAICSQFDDPTADRAYLRRVWLNQLVQASDRAFDPRWAALAQIGYRVPDRAWITIGFDGARYRDATGLVATEIGTGYQWTLGAWERPLGQKGEGWEVPELAVDECLRAAMRRFRVWRVYADPPFWEGTVARWAGDFGADVVVAWPTNRWIKMADALRSFANAIASGELSHAGDEVLSRHLGNAYRQPLSTLDAEGRPLWVIQKERADSVNKIDLAMAAVLSWQARRDALTAGAGKTPRSKYDDGAELLVLGRDAAPPEEEVAAEGVSQRQRERDERIEKFMRDWRSE